MKHLRQLIIDTETTGLDPKDGHRIIEIGCVELIDRQFTTNNNFHVYINPQRSIDSGATAVHGITDEFLENKPTFAEIVEKLLAYIADAELVAHNAPFDISFLNYELKLLGKKSAITDYVTTVVDTLKIARKKHPGQRNNLDALCKRYKVDCTKRNLHGALLDARLLAEVYLRMTGGQTSLLDLFEMEESANDQSSKSSGSVDLKIDNSVNNNTDNNAGNNNGNGNSAHEDLDLHANLNSKNKHYSEIVSDHRKKLKVSLANEEELKQHIAYLEKLKKIAGKCLWQEQK